MNIVVTYVTRQKVAMFKGCRVSRLFEIFTRQRMYVAVYEKEWPWKIKIFEIHGHGPHHHLKLLKYARWNGWRFEFKLNVWNICVEMIVYEINNRVPFPYSNLNIRNKCWKNVFISVKYIRWLIILFSIVKIIDIYGIHDI